MKKRYNLKKTISFKMFISEFGDNFTEHMKKRLLEIGNKCILTRKEIDYCFDLKHVEHIKYECGKNDSDHEMQLKEYAYGQLIVDQGELYFSDECFEGDEVMQPHEINDLYHSIAFAQEYIEGGMKAKKIEDSNIDFLIDNLCEICPPVSNEYLKIISKYRK